MKSIQIKDKNIEKAIEKGLKELNTSRDKVIIEVLEERKAKFFNIIGENFVKIKISLKDNDFEYDNLNNSEYNIDLKKIALEIKKILEDIIKKMRFNLYVDYEIDNYNINLYINGADSRFIIGKFGETLDALEYIIRSIMSKKEKIKINFFLDVDNYRKEREKKLIRSLNIIADRVLKTGIPEKMIKLNKKERRKVHLFFEKYDRLETKSFGEGENRYILVMNKYF